MNVLSLFNGMSVGYYSLKQAGIKIDKYFSSEIEQSSINVSQHHFPDIIQIGDVKNWRNWNLPKIDLLIGGSPCQGFSRQGGGLNFEDPRSKLFFDFKNVMDHLLKINPKMKVLLENVDMKKEWQNTITENLGFEPKQMNSDLLIPQNRPRTYWCNFEWELPQKKNYTLISYLDDFELKEYVYLNGIKIEKKFGWDSIDLVENVDGQVRIKQPVSAGYAIAEVGDGINLSFPKSKTRRGRVVKGRSSCLDTSCNIGVFDNNNQIRYLNTNELERLQGLPTGFTSMVSENQGKKMLGNGWTADAITHIFKEMIK